VLLRRGQTLGRIRGAQAHYLRPGLVKSSVCTRKAFSLYLERYLGCREIMRMSLDRVGAALSLNIATNVQLVSK
jgi:hypothetical protein